MTESKEGEAKHQEAINKIIQKLDTSSFTFHKKSPATTIAELKTNIKTGLTKKEAENRLAEHGPNALQEEEGETIWQKIKEQFEDMLV
jgi:magnesium-transporting ATPase (P-type)